jgi:hypothetical protein
VGRQGKSHLRTCRSFSFLAVPKSSGISSLTASQEQTRSIAEMAWDQPKTTVVVRYTDNNQIPRRDDSGYYICDAEECTTHYKTPPIFLEHVKDVRAGRIYLCDKCHGKFNRTSILTPEVLAKRRCRKGECDGKPMVSRTTRGPRQKLKDRADCFQGYIRQ